MFCEHDYNELPDDKCGCTFIRCSKCEVVRKTSLCEHHADAYDKNVDNERSYYETMGAFGAGGLLLNKPAIDECKDALGELSGQAGKYNILKGVRSVLEVGCGIGRLVPFFLRLGMSYVGWDRSEFATKFVNQAYDVGTICADFVDQVADEHKMFFLKSDLLVSMHALEHFEDPELALRLMLHISEKQLILVPNQRDICNPDHWTAFSENTIKTWLPDRTVYVHVVPYPSRPEDYVYIWIE